MAKLPSYQDHLDNVAWRNHVPTSVAKSMTVTREQWDRTYKSRQCRYWNQQRKVARARSGKQGNTVAVPSVGRVKSKELPPHTIVSSINPLTPVTSGDTQEGSTTRLKYLREYINQIHIRWQEFGE